MKLIYYPAKDNSIFDYLELLKLRVMSLVVFTGACGIYLAPSNIHPFVAFIAILCITLASGAAGCINMWYDQDIDAIMSRTKHRPIPSGRVLPEDAAAFGVVIALFSVVIMAVAVNLLSAFLLLFAILFYVFIYTIWLKRRTAQNIVIGGASGAFPPMIGWVCATGKIDLEACVLFLIIFFWTAPHFWSLALYKNDDYKKAGIPMLPVVAGIKTTCVNILIYSIILFPFTLLPYFLGLSSKFYLFWTIFVNAIFIANGARLVVEYKEKLARKNFYFSILYLFSIFMVMAVDKMVMRLWL